MTDETREFQDPASTALEVAEVVVSYGPVPAVRGVSLAVPRGSIFGIIGRNGAGKSSLLRCIAGLEPATSGSVIAEGTDITHLRTEERVAAGVALVPEGRSIFRKLTVRENLAMGAFHRKLSRGELEADIEWATSQFPQLRDRHRQRAGLLSGGQQQMLAIARSLMAKPRLLLVDEPSLGLAPIVVDTLYELLSQLAGPETTIVVVEQHVQMVLEFASELCVLDKGEAVITGTSSDLGASTELLAAYLGDDTAGAA